MSSAVVYFALQPLRSLRGPRNPGQQLGAAHGDPSRAHDDLDRDADAPAPDLPSLTSALPDTGANTARTVRALLDLPESFEVDDI